MPRPLLTFSLFAGALLCLIAQAPGGAAGASDHRRPPPSEARSLRAPCRSAVVGLGWRPGVLRLRARCLRRHAHFFRFIVNRASRSGGAAAIEGFSRRPLTRGPGTVSKHGSCEATRFGLVCEARARGRVTLQGTLRVAPGSQCATSFSITQVAPDSCQLKPNAACPESLEIEQLFRGPAHGC